MYNSGVSISQLISDVKREIDVVVKVPSSVYADALNYVQQMIYGDIVKEIGLISYDAGSEYVLEIAPKDTIPIPNNNNPKTTHYKATFQDVDGCDSIRFEDIAQVYYNGVELYKSEMRECLLIPDTYAKYDDGVLVNVDVRADAPNKLAIMFVKRPKQVRAISNGFSDGNVMLPNEFIELAKSYIRGAVYKSANEDALAAKWINDFNNMLETFKVWSQAHR